MLKTHTLFVNVTVEIDWSMHVRWLTLAQEFEVTESQMFIDFGPTRSSSGSASVAFAALEPAKNNYSRIRK